MENEVLNIEQKKVEIINALLEKGKGKGRLSYKEISDQLFYSCHYLSVSICFCIL